jgi:hypothetical protein
MDLDDIGNAIEKGVFNFSKRAVGAMAPKYLKGLAIASEPFFQKNMGQRYIDSTAFGCAFGLWLLASALCIPFGTSGGRILSEIFRLYALANAITHLRYLGCLLGLVAAFAFIHLVTKDMNSAMQRHFTGQPRHSMTRGEPRFKDPAHNLGIKVLAGIGLLLFATPLGVLFVISRVENAKLMADQQAAIMSRYFDAIDSKIESEQLESALLGQSPVEHTYLHRALSNDLPDDMRKNIAAAAASTARVVSQPPKSVPVSTSNPSVNNSRAI